VKAPDNVGTARSSCPHCSREFKPGPYLSGHIRACPDNPDRNKGQCPHCSVMIAKGGPLNAHLRSCGARGKANVSSSATDGRDDAATTSHPDVLVRGHTQLLKEGKTAVVWDGEAQKLVGLDSVPGFPVPDIFDNDGLKSVCVDRDVFVALGTPTIWYSGKVEDCRIPETGTRRPEILVLYDEYIDPANPCREWEEVDDMVRLVVEPVRSVAAPPTFPVSEASLSEVRGAIVRRISSEVASGKLSLSQVASKAGPSCADCVAQPRPRGWDAATSSGTCDFVMSAFLCDCAGPPTWLCDVSSILVNADCVDASLLVPSSTLTRAITPDVEVRQLTESHESFDAQSANRVQFGLFNTTRRTIPAGSLLGDVSGAWRPRRTDDTIDSYYILDFRIVADVLRLVAPDGSGPELDAWTKVRKCCRFDIDQNRVGNEFRFLNHANATHACNTKFEGRLVFDDSADSSEFSMGLPKSRRTSLSSQSAANNGVRPAVLVIAAQDILPGDELLIDYGGNFPLPAPDLFSLARSLDQLQQQQQ
jgi:SET domain